MCQYCRGMDARRWSAVGLIGLGGTIIIAGLALAGCGPTPSASTTPTAPKASTAKATASPTPTCAHTSPLTGACTDPNAPVLIVKIDDLPEARPQFHLNQTDMVLVEPVEGGLTRLFAVYNGTLPDIIGPIRSARITDTDLAPAFGDPLFAYSGSQAKLVPYLQATRMQMIGAPQGGTGYYRLSDRQAPHNYVANVQQLLTRVSDSSTARLDSTAYWRIDATATDSGTAITSARIDWPASQKSFIWDAKGKRWGIDVYGQPLMTQIDANRHTERAYTTNVVIMESHLLASEFGDKFGARTPYPQTVGSGRGMVLVDGMAIPATWQRPTKFALPRWFDAQGHEIALRPGNTWWLVVTDLGTVHLQTPAPAQPDTATASATTG